MDSVTYRSPDLLHWFGAGSDAAVESAKRRTKAAAEGASKSDIKKSLVNVAGAALDIGRMAAVDIVKRQIEDTVYRFDDDVFEVQLAIGTKRIRYEDVASIVAKTNDRYVVTYAGGSITVKPVAHLVSGRVRVPIGWIRNGLDVSYATLAVELAARCDLDIEPA